jgi:RNA-binding protein
LFNLWHEETLSNCEGTTFEKNRLRHLQSRSRRTEPTIWIGKEGASQELLTHIKNQLKARELVKVKVQKTALAEVGTREVAEKVAESTTSTLLEVMGHTFSLYKKRTQIEKTTASSKPKR